MSPPKWFCPVLASLALVLAACGDDRPPKQGAGADAPPVAQPVPPVAPPAPAPKPGEPVPPGGPSGGDAADGTVVLRFVLDLAAARREGRITPQDEDRDVLYATVQVVAGCLNGYARLGSRVTLVGDDRFDVMLPNGADPEAVKRLVSAVGIIEFRIEVLPDIEYLPESDTGQVKRRRSGLWAGAKGPTGDAGAREEFAATVDGFRRFRDRETARFRQARERGEPYVPMDARYRVVPRENTPRATADDFAVLEEPREPRLRFGGEILAHVWSGPDQAGDPAVLIEVSPERQDDFAKWSRENVMLPMAIVLDGEYHSAPYITSSLRDSVVISLGGVVVRTSPGESGRVRRARIEDEQRRLVAILATGTLRVAPRFEERRTVEVPK